MVNHDYWTPTRGMDYVINNLYSIINNNAVIYLDTEVNDIYKYPLGSYLELESLLIKLASHTEIIEDNTELDTTNYPKVYNVKSETYKKVNNKYWKGGTGYGTDSTRRWNVDEFIELQKEKDIQLCSILENIIISIQSHPEDDIDTMYNILQNSYIIPFIKSLLSSTTFLEIEERYSVYNLVLSIIFNISNENGMILFVKSNDSISLMEIFEQLYKKAIKIKKMDDNDEDDICNTILTLYDMIKPCYDNYISNIHHEIPDNCNEEEKESTDLTYIDIMKQYMFDSDDILSNNFAEKLSKEMKDKQPSRKLTKRVAQEYSSLMENLPIHLDASIFLKTDINNILVSRAIISGPQDTPYANGLYIFDILMPENYPDKPPSVIFRNHGTKRFNPNLYQCGKVCLSLLGTWHADSEGEKWIPNKSTLYQVLNSIQSLILIDQPYFNEPNYEKRMGTGEGNKRNLAYNMDVRLFTMNHTMNDILEEPTKYGSIENIINDHFRLKKDHILEVCNKWVQESDDNHKTQYEQSFERLKTNLEKISNQ